MFYQKILGKIDAQRLLKMIFSLRPESELLIFNGQRLTRRQVFANIQALGGGLQSLGIVKGNRVATLLPACPEAVYTTFLPEMIGSVHVPLNPLLSERELAHILKDCGARAVVIPERFFGQDYPALLGRLRSELPDLSTVVVTNSVQGDGKFFFGMDEILARGKPPASIRLSGDHLTMITYTSGTTGLPKGVMHTLQRLFNPAGPHLNLSLRRCLLLSFPPYQIAGMIGIVGVLLGGGRIILMDRFDPMQMLEAIQEERVTQVAGSPTMYRLMLMTPKGQQFDLSSLRRATFGSEPCPPELARAIFERFHCTLENMYATTESLLITWAGPHDDWKIAATTVGKPVPGARVRIVDDQHRPLPVGERGEIAVQTSQMMVGYYNDPGLTAQVLDAEGWFYTGDIGTLDEKGYLRLIDRKKDVIIRGGQNIFPAEVEAWLGTHPGVRRVAVVGVPHSLTGEAIWAFVELQPGAKLTARDVLSYCRGQMTSYKIPEQVRFLDQLPVTAIGKIQKFKLRELAQQELSREK